MRTLLWVTRPEMSPFAGAQQDALQAGLRGQGWQVTVAPYQNRLLWRQRQRFDALLWTFVPTQMEVWLAKRSAAAQFGLIHELPPRPEPVPVLDHWLAPSRSLREALCNAGVPPADATVSSALPALPAGRPMEVRRELELAGGTPLVYAAGPLIPSSGNRIAVWALNILNYLHPEVHLLLHGEGAERERLLQFSRSIDERRRVHVVPASWPTTHLVTQADQVWLPRQWDGVPDALFFALRAGKPILAARQSSLGEWLQNEGNALLVRPDQPAEWAAGAKRLFEDVGLSVTLAESAGRTALPSKVTLEAFGPSANQRLVLAA